MMATRHIQSDVPGGVVNDLSGYTYAEANPIRFSSKYHDAETGLGYWGYRYYSARLGRWLSRDPLGEAGDLNLYRYVASSPISQVDPDGRIPLDALTGLAAYALCPWPSAPEPLSLPPATSTRNPWLLWVTASRGEEIIMGGSWSRYVRSLPATQELLAQARGDLKHRLYSFCGCGRCDERKDVWISGGPFELPAWFGAYEPVYPFLSINGMHLRYFGPCNINSCCTHCKVSCTLTVNVFDSFHFDVNPIARGALTGRGLSRFFWHVLWTTQERLAVRCVR
jgi:RHS repeat-associated protein